MNIIYFGAAVPVYPLNGNWGDVNQWYSSVGSSGKGGTFFGTPLGRLPNANTDFIRVHENVAIKSNVGTYPGIVVYGIADDPNAVWTGNTSFDLCASGTFHNTGRVSMPDPVYGYLSGSDFCHIANGVFLNINSNSTTIFGPAKYDFNSITYYVPGNYNINAITNPTFVSYGIYLYGGRTWTKNLKCNQIVINNWASPDYYVRSYSERFIDQSTFNQKITITSDISTPNTGAYSYKLTNCEFTSNNTIYFGNNQIRLTDVWFDSCNISNDLVFTGPFLYPGSGQYDSRLTFNSKVTFTGKITLNVIKLGSGGRNVVYNIRGGSSLIHAPKVDLYATKSPDGSYNIDYSLIPQNVFALGIPPYRDERLTNYYAGGFVGDQFLRGSYQPSMNVINLPFTSNNIGGLLE